MLKSKIEGNVSKRSRGVKRVEKSTKDASLDEVKVFLVLLHTLFKLMLCENVYFVNKTSEK